MEHTTIGCWSEHITIDCVLDYMVSGEFQSKLKNFDVNSKGLSMAVVFFLAVEHLSIDFQFQKIMQMGLYELKPPEDI